MRNKARYKEILAKLLRNHKVNDVGILASSQYTAVGFSFLTTVVAARLLGPTNYGIAALVMAYPMFLWVFVGVKSANVTTRYISGLRATGRNEEIKSICKLGYGLDFFTSMITLILVSATAGWVSQDIFHLSGKSWMMIAYTASLTLLSLSATSWAILSSWDKFHLLAVSQILEKAVAFIMVLVFLLSGFGIAGVIIGTAIGNIVSGLFTFGWAMNTLHSQGLGFWWKTSLKSLLHLRKELITFSGWNYLTMSFNSLVAHVPLMMLGYLRGPQEAGFYRLAVTFTMLGSYLEISPAKVAYPLLSNYWGKRSAEDIKTTLRRWTIKAGIPIGILLLLTVPLLPIIFSLTVGPGYSSTVLGTQVMMVGAALSAVLFWLIIYYQASGKFGFWATRYGVYTAIVIGLGWFCIQWWGFLGLTVLITLAKITFIFAMALSFPESPFRKYRQDIVKNYISNHKMVCFTSWFPVHNNCRYLELFPRLKSHVQFYRIMFSRQRIIRILQYHLWQALRRRFIYPIVLWFLSRCYETLFTIDPYQIPAWPRHKSVVVDIDDPVFSTTEIKLLNLPQVKAIIVTMERIKKIFRQLGVVSPIYIIPQGVSQESIDSYKVQLIRVKFKRENDLVVGYYAPTLTLSSDGSRRARQGLDDLDFLLDVVDDARKMEPRIKLWLLGEPSESVKKYVTGGGKSWIKLFGYLPFCDILNYVSNFDIAVYPRTRQEPLRFRIKITQSMACGIPIISTNLQESFIIKEAGCGIICDSYADFVKALVMLAQSVEMRLKLGKAGQRYAAANLNCSALDEQYKHIVSQV